MRLGIFAKTFARPSLGETLDAVVTEKIGAIQFNMGAAGGPALPREVTAATADAVRAAVSARGLSMAAVSGTYNMAHPDPEVRADGGARLAALIAAAPCLGTRVVTLCTGTRDPDDPWRGHPENSSRAAWRDSAQQIAAALAAAEEHGVVLAFEPEQVCGGRWVAELFGKGISEGAVIGESWEQYGEQREPGNRLLR